MDERPRGDVPASADAPARDTAPGAEAPADGPRDAAAETGSASGPGATGTTAPRFQGRRPFHRSSSYLRSYVRAIWHHRVELTVLALVVVAITLVAATTAYWFERDAGTFASFWEAFYWAATTVTTVGYGDVVPATKAGQVVAVLSSFFGAGFLLVAAGVVAVSFARVMER